MAMALRTAVRYAPVRFSSNSSRNLIVEVNTINQSFSLFNQTTVKPYTTNNHCVNQSEPNSDQFSCQGSNHLDKRVITVKLPKKSDNRVRALQDHTTVEPSTTYNHGFNQSRPKTDQFSRQGFNHAEKGDNKVKAVDRVEKVEKPVYEVESNHVEKGVDRIKAVDGVKDLTTLRRELQELKLKQLTDKGFNHAEKGVKAVEDRMGKVEKLVKEVESNHVEKGVNRVTAVEDRVEKVEKLVKEVEEKANSIEQNMTMADNLQSGSIAKAINNYKAVEDRVEKVERIAKGVKEKADSVELVMILADNRVDKIERIVKGVEKRANGIEKTMVSTDNIHSSLIDKAFYDYKAIEERVKKIEKVVKEAEKYGEDLTYLEHEEDDNHVGKFQQFFRMLKHNFNGTGGDRMSKIEERMNQGIKKVEKLDERLKEVDKFVKETRKINEEYMTDIDRKVKSFQKMIDCFDKRYNNSVEFMVNQVEDRMRKDFGKVEERIVKKAEEQVAAKINPNPGLYVMYGAGVYAGVHLVDYTLSILKLFH